MSFLDPKESFEHFQSRVADAIKEQFPLKGRKHTIILDKVGTLDALDPNDIASQYKAKTEKKTWAVPITGNLRVIENATGKTLHEKEIRLGDLPMMTNRFSYIIDGQEYQVANQWQLKPGVYTRRCNNGELESQVNAVGRSAFRIGFDPNNKLFSLNYKKAKPPLYPFLSAMGVSDEEMRAKWGDEVFMANKNAKNTQGALGAFHKTLTKKAASSDDEARRVFLDTMKESKLRPDAVENTLGIRADHVSRDVLFGSTQKLLKVQAGHPEDDRDSLIFKDLRNVGDFAYDKIKQSGKDMRAKISRQLAFGGKADARQLVRPDVFNKPIRDMFRTAVANVAAQINPVEMISNSQQTTIMGPGGIQGDEQIVDSAKMINATHLGYLDPINTPEGGRTGVTLRLPLGVKKIGNDACTPLYNLKTGKVEYVAPTQFLRSNVVLPDQVKWVNGKPVPVRDKVQAAVGGSNALEDIHFKDAHYVMNHTSQVFNLTSNLVPFIGNNSGGRISMADRHIEQTISLKNREAPLVQAGTGVEGHSFEKYIGKMTAHMSPVDGEVVHVAPGLIQVKDKSGKVHDVQTYNNFPLNDAKGVLHSEALVVEGQKVKKDQCLADNNFTKDGVLAIGTHLRVGYLPYKGLNYEDGVVISRDAAQKLASVHMHKSSLPVYNDVILNKSKFQTLLAGVFDKEKLEKLDGTGVVKVGQVLKPGDPIIAALRPYNPKDKYGFSAIRKSMSGQHVDGSLLWDHDHAGEVVAVHRNDKDVTVHIKTVEPMQVGDKLAGRYGNKGVVVSILDNDQMPRDKDGKHIDACLNPTGIPGRMNLGQVYETALTKVARKTGKPVVIDSFTHGQDTLKYVQDQLKKHGLSDTEELFDSQTGASLGHVLVGEQHINKLVHQVEKKTNVRSGMTLPGMMKGESYDLNLQPTSGGGQGGQSFGSLGVFSLLAHGAVHNLRDAQAYKSEGPDPEGNANKKWDSAHGKVWEAIQTGMPLPTPKITFAYKKFEDYLKGAGINIQKQGHNLALSPLTDKQILAMSEGRQIVDATRMVYEKMKPGEEPRPIPGGIYDEKLTGGHGGKLWSHIKLGEPIPNPMFEKPIQKILGLDEVKYNSLVRGELAVNQAGKFVPIGDGLTAGAAIEHLLKKIDVKAELPKAIESLNKAPPSKQNAALAKVKYLKALDKLGMKADEAYVLHYLPVIPPKLRPVSVMATGDLNVADVSQLYRGFGRFNNQLADPNVRQTLSDKRLSALRAGLYDGVKAIMGMGVAYKDQKHKGLLNQIGGSSPKSGYFQDKLVERRQDLTMRTTIVPEPALGLDQVGLPKETALEMFMPFVVKKLVDMGHGHSAAEAQLVLKKKGPVVWKALEKVMDERPVIMKRDPVLHKYGIQAFKPILAPGNAIQIHPLVCGGFGADFDGDTMAAFLPVSKEAVEEAHRMMPSNNLFNDAYGKIMYKPTLEYALGLYKLTETGKQTDHKYVDEAAAMKDAHLNKFHYNDIIEVAGKKTTAGRLMLAKVLPDSFHTKIKHDFGFKMNGNGLDDLLTAVGKQHPKDFPEVVDQLKNLGSGAAYGIVNVPTKAGSVLIPGSQTFVAGKTHTLSLKDFTPDYASRDSVYGKANELVEKIRAGAGTEGEKNRKIVDIYMKAEDEMKKTHFTKVNGSEDGSNLLRMYNANIKPGWAQYKQMVLAPGLMKDSNNDVLPTPIQRSYAEGLSIGDYWTGMHGARRGAVMKVQEVQEPGYMSKLLANSTFHMKVPESDCGTTRGLLMHVDDRDAQDRHFAQDAKFGNVQFKAGEQITGDKLSLIRSVDKNAKILVRSPLKCESEHGVCQHCMGLTSTGQHPPIGTNIGIQATQAIGERAVQITLKEFHKGGVAESGGPKMLSQFEYFNQLVRLPKDIAHATPLATVSGKVEKIVPTSTGVNIFIQGQPKPHFVGKDVIGKPLHKFVEGHSTLKDYAPWVPPVVGMEVKAGQPLGDPNRTIVNPHDLYSATGSMERVQNHLVDEMHKLYAEEGVYKKHIEVLVKAMSSMTKVEDPHGHPDILRGDIVPFMKLQKLNRELQKQGKPEIEHKPIIKGVAGLPHIVTEDWMGKLQHDHLRTTIAEAAAMGGRSNLHGPHPIPGIAYGAEFGLNAKAVGLKPEYTHLRNVKDYEY